MKTTFSFNDTEITNLDLSRFEGFLIQIGDEPAPGSLAVLAPCLPDKERLGLHDSRVRAVYAVLSARYPRLLRWVAAGRFTRELILSGISGLGARWNSEEDRPHYVYPESAENARWEQIESIAFPEIVIGTASTEVMEQWKDLHREF